MNPSVTSLDSKSAINASCQQSNDGKILADIIKGVHRRLRQELKESGDSESAWINHCRNKTQLKGRWKEDEAGYNEYAKSMHQLATEHWEQLRESNPDTSRINWCLTFLLNYFLGNGCEIQRQKSKLNIEWPKLVLKDAKISVLDVGSCYNPFNEYSKELDVLPIDLCPALESVYQCDFLTVPVGEKNIIEDQSILVLASNSFHCVVFSFLLEYFPSSKQRWTCCQKAQQLLMEEGVLLIITPDSKAAHSNSKVMRSWREALDAIGLKRIKYEKLLHAHCMAFRKTSVDPSQELTSQDRECLASKMYIPQDFNNQSDSEHEEKDDIKFTEEELAEGFTYLPMLNE